MKIIYNNLIPFRGFRAMNLFGVLFVRGKRPLSKYTLNHENIHTHQMKYMLYILFYFWYVIEWLIKLLVYFNFDKAYRNISFEREAYDNQNDLTYKPKPYGWVKRIIK